MIDDWVAQEDSPLDVANREVARGWMNYSAGAFPSSRDLEDLLQGQARGINQSALHVGFLCTNMGSLFRRPGLGK